MPMVQVTWLPRDVDTKRRVAAALTEALVKEAKCKPEAVHIAFIDVPKENFANGGVIMYDGK